MLSRIFGEFKPETFEWSMIPGTGIGKLECKCGNKTFHVTQSSDEGYSTITAVCASCKVVYVISLSAPQSNAEAETQPITGDKSEPQADITREFNKRHGVYGPSGMDITNANKFPRGFLG